MPMLDACIPDGALSPEAEDKLFAPDTAAAETRLLAAPVTFTTAAGPRDLACVSTGWLMPSDAGR
jgi:hypothetical protein